MQFHSQLLKEAEWAGKKLFHFRWKQMANSDWTIGLLSVTMTKYGPAQLISVSKKISSTASHRQ